MRIVRTRLPPLTHGPRKGADERSPPCHRHSYTPHPKTLQCDRACLDSVIRAGYDAPEREISVTLDATANSSPARTDANPALTAVLAVTAIAAATLAGAWVFQLVLDIRPCPLCLEHRYAYYLVVPLCALTALAAAQNASRAVLLIG